MNDPRPARWRCDLLFGALVVVLGALGWRVWQIQHDLGPALIARAERQERRVIDLPARPGNILARTRGGLVVVASSRQAPSCFADPALIGEADLAPVAERVAAAVGRPAAEIYARLYAARFKRFTYLARGVSDAQAQAVRQLKIRGVGITREWRRHYPYGPLGAHVLGYRQIDGQPMAGVELDGDRWLGATGGREVIRSDAGRRGIVARVLDVRAPRDGGHVVLTMDVAIQGFLEAALAEAVERFRLPAERSFVTDPRTGRAKFKGTAAMGVVMDPYTGAVLAMASVPTYDPNHYGKAHGEQRRNRAITDPYEPGSVFKPFIAAGAVQTGKATLDTVFFCHHGTYHARRGGTIRDFPGERFGDLPLSEIVIHSSNIGMAKVGELLGNRLLHRIAWAFGFGQATGLHLPGECPGRLVPAARWTSYATRRLPFGQGPIMVTALQLAGGFCAIANGGVLMAPRIIDRAVACDGLVLARNPPRPIRRVLDPQVARRMIDEALVQVVQRGTGKRCGVDRWQAFGKTGTGQIGTPHGYEERAYTATFAAGAPAWRPRAVCVISVYRPDYAKGYTGGKVAAPYVGQVLAKTLAYLDVPPDEPEAFAAATDARLGGARRLRH